MRGVFSFCGVRTLPEVRRGSILNVEDAGLGS